MAQRRYQLRLEARYRGRENAIAQLSLSQFDADGWQSLALDETSPGFLLFVYSLFSCQHQYLRANAAERGLGMGSASGEMDLTADEGWALQSVRVSFDVDLVSGTADEVSRGAIIERMKGCPVSRNLAPGVEVETRLQFNPR